ncbi:MAG: PQQ-dependent sugar dehydrogenase [Verrucomicrobiae bacterium]|nr:PQQ-dependent sugar dehydrogenase [Verrucomicrobiae bacterium]
MMCFPGLGRGRPVWKRLWAGARSGSRLAGFALAIATSPHAAAAPHPWEDRIPLDLAEPGLVWIDAFGSMTFENPVAVAAPPGETNRIFVVERTGRIRVVPDLTRPEPADFLDLTPELASEYLETGVLGLAFHPDYARNRRFFVFRTTRGTRPDGGFAMYNVLARYEAFADDPNRADPDSEFRLIVQEDASPEHNAGDLQFGPDGFLHVSLGDMSPPPDQHDGSRQPIDGGFFGAILRIDVDEHPENLPPNPHPSVHGGYRIPADNPFVGLTEYFGRTYRPDRVRTEFFAIGFRNPWRMSFHEPSGELWVGDVGDGAFEEINVVRPGGNYGWPYLEGRTNGLHWFLAPPGFESDPPLVAYGRGSGPYHGNAVIGGLFYHGAAIPRLQGAYLYADSRSGHTWAIRRDPGGPAPEPEWLAMEPGLVSFGRDPRDGEILAVHYPSGRLRKLIDRPPVPSNRIPPTLADTGLFADLANLTPSPGLLPYALNAPFWSDRAAKKRWFALPSSQPTLGTQEDGSFSFPTGTIWVKHFEMEGAVGHPPPGRRLETRLLVRTESGAYGVTYRWDPTGTNAVLVPGSGMDEPIYTAHEGTTRHQSWRYPGWGECMRCHTRPAGYALGFRTEQLNRTVLHDGHERSQIELLRDAGILPHDFPKPDALPALVDPADPSRPLHRRARSYLDSNCSGCHRPGSLPDTTATWNAQHTPSLAAMGLLNGRLIIPGAPADSELVRILGRTSPSLRMPPLGSSVRDPLGYDLVAQWASSIPRAPWLAMDFGSQTFRGESSVEGSTVTLSSRAGPWSTANRSGHALVRPLQGDGFLEARLNRLESTEPGARAGIVLTELSGSVSAAAWLGTLDGPWHFHWNPDAPGEASVVPSPPFLGPVRLRVTREGRNWSATISDGTHSWEQSLDPAALPVAPVPGLTVASGVEGREAHAWFDQIAWVQTDWESPALESIVAPHDPVPIRLRLEQQGVAIRQIDLLLDDQPLESVVGSQVTRDWTPTRPGTYRIAARITTLAGDSFNASARIVHVREPVVIEPDPIVDRIREDRTTLGDPEGRYGLAGYQYWDRGSSLPSPVTVHPRQGAFHVWGEPSTDPSAILVPGASTRSAFTWYAFGPLDIDIAMPDGNPRSVALYFLDWDTDNRRAQEVTFLNPANGEVLGHHRIESFTAGAHLVFDMIGSVRVRIEGRPTETTVLSGVLLDDAPEPAFTVHLTTPESGITLTAPVDLTLTAEVRHDASPPPPVEFLADGRSLGTVSEPPHTLAWNRVPAGTHHLQARASDRLGRWSVSPAVQVAVILPPAEAAFLGYESAARGTWEGRLGSLGYALATGPSHWPDAVAFQPVNQPREYVWHAQSPDPRAAVPINSTFRRAACWVGGEPIEFDFDFLDGLPAILSMYLLDWESDQRRQVLEFLDRATGAPLLAIPAERFFNGVHFVFHVRGSIRIRVSPEFINATVTGFFADRAAATPHSPILHPPLLVEEGLSLSWTGTPGALYRLITRPDWATPWTPLPIVASSVSDAFQTLDPIPDDGVPPSRFLSLEQLSDPSP